jgi:hypothetical protein
MSTITAHPSAGPFGWLRRAEAWLDQKGRWAWIAAMVLGFIIFWPVGLALLAYIIWGKRMFAKSCRHRSHHGDTNHRAFAAEWGRMDRTAWRATGNAAFDSYKADTLRRLEDEQEAFEAFLQRLRAAKDKTEFDTFMDDRAKSSTSAAPADTTPMTGPQEDLRRGEY